MIYTFEQVKPWLKVSKTVHADNAPYTLRWVAHQDWAEIQNKHGETVGQVSGLEWLEHGPRGS